MSRFKRSAINKVWSLRTHKYYFINNKKKCLIYNINLFLCRKIWGWYRTRSSAGRTVGRADGSRSRNWLLFYAFMHFLRLAVSTGEQQSSSFALCCAPALLCITHESLLTCDMSSPPAKRPHFWGVQWLGWSGVWGGAESVEVFFICRVL